MTATSRRARAATAFAGAILALTTVTGCVKPDPSGSDALYGVDANWLCRPGTTATNYCTTADLDQTTVIDPDDSRHVVTTPALDQSKPTAPFDCFYVYPTVNAGDPMHPNDVAMAADPSQEAFVTRAQFARYSTICNTFAPLYRQATIAGISRPGSFELAYGDVRAAFHRYLRDFSGGRPFLLVGHSQGSFHLTRLVREEIEGDVALRARFIAAFLIGGSVNVARGQDTGGSFRTTRLCHSTAERGCVVAFNSTGTAPATAPTPAASGATTLACTNPAALGGGPGLLDNMIPTFKNQSPAFLRTLIPMPARYGDLRTSFLSMPGAMRAECVDTGAGSYLHISVAGDPGDRRAVAPFLASPAGGSLHVVETSYTLGNLLALARRLAAGAA